MTELERAVWEQLREAFPEPWYISMDHLFTRDWRVSVIRAGVSVLGIGKSCADAAESAIKNWKDAR